MGTEWNYCNLKIIFIRLKGTHSIPIFTSGAQKITNLLQNGWNNSWLSLDHTDCQSSPFLSHEATNRSWPLTFQSIPRIYDTPPPPPPEMFILCNTMTKTRSLFGRHDKFHVTKYLDTNHQHQPRACEFTCHASVCPLCDLWWPKICPDSSAYMWNHFLPQMRVWRPISHPTHRLTR